RYMRKEFYQPELASRDKREQMGPDGTAGERARAAVARMRVAPAESLLDPAVRSRLIETFPEIKQAASA
ncbi:MAG: hypothetical protein ACOCYN_01330, partial [Planctomycetota bacterium]